MMLSINIHGKMDVQFDIYIYTLFSNILYIAKRYNIHE